MNDPLLSLRRAGESALRHLADMFADDTHPPIASDVDVEATIVFADIEGFSDTVAREGDDAATTLLDALDHAVEAALQGTGARLVKRLGDGVMIAAEDPLDGVVVATELPVRFAERTRGLHYDLRLRAGAHRGLVRRRGEDLIGYHVNVAARVTEQAPGGTTLVTGALLQAVSDQHRLLVRPMGALVAKGVPERPPLYAVSALVREVD